MIWNEMLKKVSIWKVWLSPQITEIYIINYCRVKQVNPSKYLHHSVDPEAVQEFIYDRPKKV